MSIKSILCAYSGDPEQGSGLRYAIQLAKRFDAHLTGVAKAGGIGFLHRQFEAHLPASVIAQLDENGRQMLHGIAERFMEKTAQAGLGAHAHFVELDPQRDGRIASFARAFDLTVIGQPTASAHEDDYAAHPDLVALRSGRPVLTVPQAYDQGTDAPKVVVAWDGKRAATRAMATAMPILESGAQVTLVTVGDTPRNTDLHLETLTRHGAVSSAMKVEYAGNLGETIVTQAEQMGANLILMGAFEHSKFSHDIVGGVTTDILERARVPVLMAH